MSNLVILRHVRIEVILPVKFCVISDGAIQEVAGQRSEAQGLCVRHWKDTGQAEANRTHVSVWHCPKFIRAAAPHLGLCLKLDVRFQPDHYFVFHDNGRHLPWNRAKNYAIPSVELAIARVPGAC